MLFCVQNKVSMLEDAGADVTLVSNGKQAVESFQGTAEGAFDVILMYIMMPVMDGLTATRQIRAMDRPDAKTIPIIAMTAHAPLSSRSSGSIFRKTK